MEHGLLSPASNEQFKELHSFLFSLCEPFSFLFLGARGFSRNMEKKDPLEGKLLRESTMLSLFYIYGVSSFKDEV